MFTQIQHAQQAHNLLTACWVLAGVTDVVQEFVAGLPAATAAAGAYLGREAGVASGLAGGAASALSGAAAAALTDVRALGGAVASSLSAGAWLHPPSV